MAEEKAPFDYKRHLIKVQGGKTYLPVSARMTWFREEHPDWGIETEAIELNHEKQYAVFLARIFSADGKLIAMGTKKEDVKGFGDFIEKAETGAVGRALAMCGFGTPFAPELDEGSRFADSPRGGNDNYGNNGGGNYGNNGGNNRPAPQSNQPPRDSGARTRPPPVARFTDNAASPPSVTAPAPLETALDKERKAVRDECGTLLKALPKARRDYYQAAIPTHFGHPLASTEFRLDDAKRLLAVLNHENYTKQPQILDDPFSDNNAEVGALTKGAK